MAPRGVVAAAVAVALVAATPGAAVADAQATGVRLAGSDRIGTSIVVSQATFPANGSAHAVVLARDDDFADALSGAPLAVENFGPVLLTPSDHLDANVETEIKRVLPKGDVVYLLGNQLALADAVATQVTNDGYTATRVGGADRFATAAAVADKVNNPASILLATGDSFADALPAGAAASEAGGVVLLTDDARMPPATQDWINAHATLPVFALGAPAATADPTATAIVGADRYETSVKVAKQFFTNPNNLGFANGYAFPDALAGGAAIGQDHGPLLLVAPGNLPDVVHQYVVGVSPTVHTAEIYGGTFVIPDGVLAAIDSAIRGN